MAKHNSCCLSEYPNYSTVLSQGFVFLLFLPAKLAIRANAMLFGSMMPGFACVCALQSPLSRSRSFEFPILHTAYVGLQLPPIRCLALNLPACGAKSYFPDCVQYSGALLVPPIMLDHEILLHLGQVISAFILLGASYNTLHVCRCHKSCADCPCGLI